MPTARGLFGTSAVGGTIYAIGGTTRGRDKLAIVEAYDTATDTWTRRADMPTPRNALSAAVVDGRIVIWAVAEDGGVKVSYAIEAAAPYRLLRRWNDAGEDAVLLGRSREAYWKLNAPGGEQFLKALGLRPPTRLAP